ncbi:MAG: hypothetical protein R3E95_00345 [Thiolinea sp.]
MKAASVLLVGIATHPQTGHQFKVLEQAGLHVILLDPYGQQGQQASLVWQEEQIFWGGQDISPARVDAVVVAGLPPDVPTQDAFQQPENGQLGWSAWYQQFGLQRDRSDVILGLLLAYEAAGIPMFNPLAHTMASARKAYQLAALRQSGCKLPATLLSSSPQAAEAFIRAQGECVVKPVAGGALTISANALLLNGKLSQLAAGPAIFQQRIDGENIRAIILEDQVISCSAVAVPDDTLDFRADPAYQQGKARYRDVILPRIVQLQCRRAAMLLGLRFAGVDLKCTEQGEYFLLECDANPVYLDVEHKLGHPITQQLAQAVSAVC